MAVSSSPLQREMRITRKRKSLPLLGRRRPEWPTGNSVVEHELLGVQQGPEDIAIDLRLLLGDAPVRLELHELGLGRESAKAAQVQLRRDLARGHVLLHQLADDAAGIDLVLDGVAIEQMQRLAERGAD